MKVHFISNFGEHQDLEIAIDEGGPRRDFFRLLLDALVHTSGLLEGPETMKVFSSKVSALRRKQYYYAVAASILMGGQPLCCLAPSVVDFLLMGQSNPTLEEVTDYEIRDALKELTDSETTSEMRKILDEKLELKFSLGVDRPTFLLNINDKDDLVKDLCLSFVIHRTTESINQFADGLEILCVLTIMRKNTSLRNLLVYNNRFEITPKRFKETCKFTFCENGNNRRPVEERLAKRFMDYVDAIYENREADKFILDSNREGVGNVLEVMSVESDQNYWNWGACGKIHTCWYDAG